jgi:hypothetical protein
VQGLDGFRLQQFLDGQLIDQAIFGRLQEILEMQARIQLAQQAIYDRDEERAKVRLRLEDARSNLAPLDAKEDSKLRERFLKQLESFEDQMVQFDEADVADISKIATLESSVSAAISGL